MRKIRDVLRYRQNTDLSLEAIARALNISKGVVAKYVSLAAAAGLVDRRSAGRSPAAAARA